MPAANDYKTDYSQDKNINTLDRGSYNDWGDNTPAKQSLVKQAPGESFDVQISPKGEILPVHNEVSSVAVGSEVLVSAYTVPVGKEARIRYAKASGDNRAKFIAKLNGSNIDTSRIWWANFDARLRIDGIKLLENDKIEIFVINRGDEPSPFEATIGVDIYDV